MKGKITVQIQEKVAYISFYHPASNSFTSSQLDLLTDTFNKLSENATISVIVLQSEGEGAFCAGASFDELLQISNLDEGKKFFSGFANVINAMRKCKKIIIGKIHGKAVGGGVGLIAACDYTLGTDNAAIKLSELAIGIGPFVIEPVVSKKIGVTAMSELAYNATEWKSGKWAYEKGLLDKILFSKEDLDLELQIFVNKFSSYNPEALYEMKKVIWKGTDNWDTLLYERAEVSGKLVLSDFTKNAIAQFKKK